MVKIIEAEYADSALFMAMVEENDRRARMTDSGGGIIITEKESVGGAGGFKPSPCVPSIEDTGE